MADVESLVTNSLPGVTQLLRALAESASKAREAECAEKQQVGKEKIRCLELELVESRKRIETQALEVAALATQLDQANLQVAQSSVSWKDKLDEAVVSQFPALFKAHLDKIKAGGDFTKLLSEEEVLELKHAADMAMSTSNDFVAAREKENARMAAEDKVEEWSPPTKWTLSHTHESEGLRKGDAEQVTQGWMRKGEPTGRTM